MFLSLLVLIVFCIWRMIYIVPQGHAYVTELLGQYSGTQDAGLHFKLPIVQRVIKKVSLKEQVLDFPPQPVITKDNVTMTIDSVVFMKVQDPKLFVYGVENPLSGLQNLSATTLRAIIGDMELDQTLTSRDQINARMQTTLDVATDPQGIKVTRVEIKNIQPPKEIEEVMTKQMRAERERRQTVLEAQAHQEAVVTRAKGDQQAKVIAAQAERDAQIALAEGKAKSINLVYEAEANGIERLNKAKISNGVLRLKSIDALKDVANGRATKIFMPTDITKTVSALGVVGESLGIGDSTPIDHSPEPAKPQKFDPCIKETTSPVTISAVSTGNQIEHELQGIYDQLDTAQ